MGDQRSEFECPICFENLLPPIFQCYNGHLLCNVCIEGMKSCPICREEMPPRKIRNLEVERIASSRISFSCQNRSKGCQDLNEHELIDCPYTASNFCAYLGISCSEVVEKGEFAMHLMGSHGITGEFSDVGQAVDVCQTGGRKEDIEHGRVRWGPNFIVQGQNIMFLMTQLRGRNISWAVFILGSEARADQFVARITVSKMKATDEVPFLKWGGRVHSLTTKWNEGDGALNLYSEQLSPFCGGKEANDFGWNIRVKICNRKEGSHPKISKLTGRNQVSCPAIPCGVYHPPQPSAPPAPAEDLPSFASAKGSSPPSATTSTPPVPPRPDASEIGPNGRCRSCGMSPKTSKWIYKCLECESFNSCLCTIDKYHNHHVILVSDVQNKVEFSRIVQSLRRDGLEGKVSQDFSGVHRRIKCDGCKTSPVFGLRYKCIGCADRDFCHNCVKRRIHHHRIFLVSASPNTQERLKSAFLKIRGC